MSDTVYRLMEEHQKLDARLNHAQSRKTPDMREVLRLTAEKLAIRRRLGLLMGRHNRLSAAV